MQIVFMLLLNFFSRCSGVEIIHSVVFFHDVLWKSGEKSRYLVMQTVDMFNATESTHTHKHTQLDKVCDEIQYL
jgi:hypothetical protein